MLVLHDGLNLEYYETWTPYLIDKYNMLVARTIDIFMARTQCIRFGDLQVNYIKYT